MSRMPCSNNTASAAGSGTMQFEEFTAKNGRPPTDNEVAVLVRESRADKLMEISTEEVRKRQKARLTPEEARSLDQLRETAWLLQGSAAAPRMRPPSLLYAQEHIFERVSVAANTSC